MVDMKIVEAPSRVISGRNLNMCASYIVFAHQIYSVEMTYFERAKDLPNAAQGE